MAGNHDFATTILNLEGSLQDRLDRMMDIFRRWWAVEFLR
jgi:hypothetical protein